MMEVFCDHTDCLHFKYFDEPKHLPGRAPADWDKGYPGRCTLKAIGIRVREIGTYQVHYVIPECKCYARRKDWRLHLPYPDDIAKRGGRILGSQEHDSSR